jgi:hypothetical protein
LIGDAAGQEEQCSKTVFRLFDRKSGSGGFRSIPAELQCKAAPFTEATAALTAAGIRQSGLIPISEVMETMIAERVHDSN